MRYPAEMTDPMRQELIQMGVQQLKTAEEVDAALEDKTGTALVFVNSVCGCAAGMARPGLALALQGAKRPDRVTSVFAGVDLEATARARQSFEGHPPTSPQVALFKDGKLVTLIQRQEIEGTSPEAVASKLTTAFEEHC